jgi:CRISPR-associated endoribonuclease Cas6
MRLIADLKINTDWLVKDYRGIFMALIKSVFMKYDPVLYANLYGTDKQKRKVNKPFTFSTRFPQYKGIEGNKMLCGNKISLLFSSDEETLVIAFYNGLKEKRKITVGENFPIEFELVHIHLLPLKQIHTNKVLFKTISPVLVNEKGNNLKYISPAKPEFAKAFTTLIVLQANGFGIPCTEGNINFEINQMKKLPLSHYNQTMTSWLGEFVMEAPANVLQLVYDTGIGVRRSQGFGMLEIVKTY